MATLDVINWNNEIVGSVELPATVFEGEVAEHLLHTVVRWQLAKRRAGTHKTKERAEVNFSTKKLYRQKGTGMARRGSRKAPGLRKGGTVFGPRPRSYEFDLNKKLRRKALAAALAQKFQTGRMKVLDSAALPQIKTKELAVRLDTLGMHRTALFIDQASPNFALSARNIPGVDVLPAAGLNVYDVLHHEYLVISKEALPAVLARFGIGAE